MAVRDTSKIAYQELRETERLGEKQNQVLAAIRTLGPCHNNQILEYLNGKLARVPSSETKVWWQINQITGRVKELRDAGHVEEIGKYKGVWNNWPKIYCFWRARGDQTEPAGWIKIRDTKPSAFIEQENGQLAFV